MDGALTTQGSITVFFAGVNHPPLFPECADYMSASIAEEMPVGTPILNVSERCFFFCGALLPLPHAYLLIASFFAGLSFTSE